MRRAHPEPAQLDEPRTVIDAKGLEGETRRGGALRAFARSVRPAQWPKNLLIFGAPGAAGVLDEASAIVDTFAAVVAFICVASSIYLVNDIADREADRTHPHKRERPVAAGTLPVGAAALGAAVLAGVGFGVALVPREGAFVAVLASYAVISLLYSAGLKTLPVVEMAAVASGFVLRLLAGGYAVDVPISDWFLIVGLFGSLLAVAGKRRAEIRELVDGGLAHRPVLAAYPRPFLDLVIGAFTAIVILAYCLWAFEAASDPAEAGTNTLLFRLSVVPFTIAVLQYVLTVERGSGGAPEEVVLGDRTLQLVGMVWLALFGWGVYV